MNSWKRIALSVSVLIGGTLCFGYWSLGELNSAFDNLSDSSVAAAVSVYPSLRKEAELASTSPETSMESGTSTEPVEFTDVELSFTFPQKGDEIYSGCTYDISWEPTATIYSLEGVLVDAGTGKSAGPIASGLAKEYTLERDVQHIAWSVGVVWPGEYYIRVSKINGEEDSFRSSVFEISRMPNGIDEEEKINLCKKSGGV